MKLLLRPQLCSPALASRLAADAELARALGAEPNAAVGFVFKKMIDADAPALQRLLEQAQALGERVSLLRDLQFSAEELAQASHLEVVCRKTLAQTAAERQATLADHRSLPLQATASRWPVRLPQAVYLSKPVPADSIVHVDQYTGEYAAGAEASRLLGAAGFSGCRLLPVRHWKTRAERPELGMHLVSDRLWPAVSPSLTRGQTTTPQRAGLLSYDGAAFDGAPDGGRTAEPWGASQTPQWIVSQRVRRCVLAGGIKGWTFWPVLQEGSALHAAHEALWGRAQRLLAAAGARLA